MTSIILFEHELKEWEKSINFFSDELIIFTRRLEEAAGTGNHKLLMGDVEHFQNQFILQKENFDTLKHKIHELSGKIHKDIQNKNKLTDRNLMQNHELLHEQIYLAEKIFIELKHSFYRFIAKVV